MIPTCDLSVLVTTWNSERWIARCLESLMAQKGVCFEVLALDNGSTDGTCRLVRRLAPHARLTLHSSNIGPARARNIAIAQAKGRYVLTLDHDMDLGSGFLKTLVGRADRSLPGVGMWSGKFLRPDRRTLDSTGIVLTKRWRAFDRGGGEIDRGQWDTQREILGPSACAALYGRRMLEDIREGRQYFDERFFFLWEDVELAWRASRKGWKGEYVPSAVAIHVRNGSDLSWRRRQALSLRNRYLFLQKHRLWRPVMQYLRDCGPYEALRLVSVAVTNPAALGFLWESWRRPDRVMIPS